MKQHINPQTRWPAGACALGCFISSQVRVSAGQQIGATKMNTTTGAQRTNKRQDAIFERALECKRQEELSVERDRLRAALEAVHVWLISPDIQFDTLAAMHEKVCAALMKGDK